MDSFVQDQQNFRTRQPQWNSSSPVDVVSLGQQIDTLTAQVGALEQRKRAEYEEQRRNDFENMVFYKLSDLQARIDAMTIRHDEEDEQKNLFEVNVNQTLNRIGSQVSLRETMMDTQLTTTKASIQEKLEHMMENQDQIGVKICKLLQAELTDTEKNIANRFEQRLKAIEDRNIQRFEEFFAKTTCMLEKLVHKQCEDLQYSIEAVDCRIQRLENSVYLGLYKKQGNLHEAESEDDWDTYKPFVNDLPGYIDDSTEGEVNKGSLEVGGDHTSSMPCIEQFLHEDIIDSSNGYMANEPVQEQSGDIEGIGEWNYRACAPVQERDDSMGAEFPCNQEDNSLPPTTLPCYSCEVVSTPQVKACFGVLVSSASREELHEDLSWEDKDSSVDFEEKKGQSKKRRQGVAQV